MRVSGYLCLLALLQGIVARPADGAPRAPTRAAPAALDQLSESFETLSRRVGPAVVEIVVSRFDFKPQVDSSAELVQPRANLGSGFFLSADGLVVTNHHVIRGARRISIRVPVEAEGEAEGRSIVARQRRLVTAKLVGFDEETDLAVLKVDVRRAPKLSLADSDTLRPGQLVLAFGSPLGLQGSVTMGVVSAVGRQLTPESSVVHIQTDAPINPGNSGGPLVNARGEVVGINTGIRTVNGGSIGLGFALPSNIVRHVLDHIRRFGRVRRGIIGVHAQTITPLLASALGLPQPFGVVLGDVYPAGPAAAAGLQIGDVVIALDGKPMENSRQFLVDLYQHVPEEKVRLTILREGKQLNVAVPVVERSEDPGRFAGMVDAERNLIPRIGVLGLTLDRQLLGMVTGVRVPHGVVVAVSADDVRFDMGSLRSGDIIHTVNGRLVRDVEQLRAAVNEVRPGAPLVLQIERGGRIQFTAMEVE